MNSVDLFVISSVHNKINHNHHILGVIRTRRIFVSDFAQKYICYQFSFTSADGDFFFQANFFQALPNSVQNRRRPASEQDTIL